MKRLPRSLHWLTAAAAPLAATAACWLLDARMSLAGVSMAYLLAVIAAALLLDRAAALASCVASVLALNFLFVPPRFSLAVDSAESWLPSTRPSRGGSSRCC